MDWLTELLDTLNTRQRLGRALGRRASNWFDGKVANVTSLFDVPAPPSPPQSVRAPALPADEPTAPEQPPAPPIYASPTQSMMTNLRRGHRQGLITSRDAAERARMISKLRALGYVE